MPPARKSKSTTAPTEPEGFEPSLRELERAVARLESGELDLDEALASYEHGVRLLGRCKGLLDAAEQKVALLVGVDDQGQPETAGLDEPPPAPKADPAATENQDEPRNRASAPAPVVETRAKAARTPTPPWLDEDEGEADEADDLPF